MPWRNASAMDERCQFVLDARKDLDSFTDLCTRYGISRETGYKWLKRYEAGGMANLQDQSRAPKYHPNEVSEEIKSAILQARRTHSTWGPKKLQKMLQESDPKRSWPAVSTMGEILQRNGLSVRRIRRRQATPSTQPFACCNAANQVWCVDYKGWFKTGDGHRCDPLTITDAFSRYLLRCQIVEAQNYEIAQGIFKTTFREYGMPTAIRSDNGAPFASTGLAGLSRLSVWWMQLGIQLERIEPGKPQQNGRHERMHLTLKQETANPPAQNLRAQQRRFDAFCREYNEVRPHEALEMKTPAFFYQPSDRSYPDRLPDMEYSRGMEVRRVGGRGEFRWGGVKIFLSYALLDLK
jgi:putative transposase